MHVYGSYILCTDARVIKVNKNHINGVRILIFYRITVQCKVFWFLGFEDNIWNVSSVIVHASLDTISEARSHFAQHFRVNCLNFMPNRFLQIINIFVACKEHSSFQKLPDMSRDIACIRADNFGFSPTVSLTRIILSGSLSFWPPLSLKSICCTVQVCCGEC